MHNVADSKVSLPPDYFRQGAEFMKYLADCSDDKKVKLLEIVKQDENTYAKKMKEASDSKAGQFMYKLQLYTVKRVWRTLAIGLASR